MIPRRIVDADAHVVEPVSLFAELFARFPDDVGVRDDTALGVTLEGRHYPQFTGPGAGCPPDKGLTDAPGVDPGSCIAELEKCIREYGFVGINLNPDPSGGHWREPPLSDRHWYPIYEKMVELDIPAMIHVSTSCNSCFHTTGAHYLNADTTAFMQCLTSDLFKDFPTLRFVIPHGGGAVPYHWGRFRGLAQELKKPLLEDHLLNNIFFDTCVYHQPGIDLLARVIPAANVLFASEMIGAVRGVDPQTGHYYDDTKRYIEAAPLSAADRHRIYEGNARHVYPRLDTALKAKGR
jgi:4-oxalmesaconate hydratase